MQMRAAQLGRGSSNRLWNLVDQLQQTWQGNAAQQHVERHFLVLEPQASARKLDAQWTLPELELRYAPRHALRELSDAHARIDEVGVVAELAIVQPDGARDHVLQAG